MNLLISLAQASDENMILATIELLWITLIPRLLLLIALTVLLIKTILIALALKSRV